MNVNICKNHHFKYTVVFFFESTVTKEGEQIKELCQLIKISLTGFQSFICTSQLHFY